MAFGISGIAAGSFLAMTPFVLMHFKSSLPYMATPRRKIVLALKTLEQRVQQQQNKRSIVGHEKPRLRLTDMGSGDGEAILVAAQRGWIATGVEMNPTLWAVSMLRILGLKSEERNRARFVRGDMFSQDISSSDAIIIFGVKPLMPAIADKIRNEAKPGAFVISYRFLLPLGDQCGQIDAEIIKDQEDMRIYQLRKKQLSNSTDS